LGNGIMTGACFLVIIWRHPILRANILARSISGF